MTWLYVTLAVVVAVLLAWLYWTANRLDRMHHRIEVARASLDTQFLHRSGSAMELASSEALDPARSLLLLEAAHRARAADPADMEACESDLSQVLRAVFPDREEVRRLESDPLVGELVRELAADCRKVELARRFHNDVAVTARELRSVRRVRWLHLSGGAPEVATVNLDDEPPEALVAE
ncbi:MAG TPA: hypothetical protein VF049_19545 [Nocardioidaceae bacterium]|jgi:hypothetical protein